MTVITTGPFPSIVTSSVPDVLTTSVVIVFPTDSRGSAVGRGSTVGAVPSFGVFGVPLVARASRSAIGRIVATLGAGVMAGVIYVFT